MRSPCLTRYFPLILCGLLAELAWPAATPGADKTRFPARVQAPASSAPSAPPPAAASAAPCGVPGDPLTYYAATASGGVWKSTDGGLTWKPIFDDQTDRHASARIAVAPSDPNVIYVGTGEANIRGNVEAGNGIYKSTDAGKTWKHVWKQEGQIGTMIVHPTNPDIAYRRGAGPCLRPQPGARRLPHHRRRQDLAAGARTRTRTPAPPTSASIRPTRKILFAGLWQARRRPWELTSGGPGSGLYMSRDGGDTWTQLGAPPGVTPKERPCKGLPEGIWGKVCVAVAAVRRPARLRPDRGGEGRPVPLRRRRRHLEAGQRRPLPAPAGLVLLHAHRRPEQPRRRLVPAGAACSRASTAARRSSASRARTTATITTSGSIRRTPKRMIDSNDGGVDVEHQRRRDLVRAAAADLPVLSRQRRQPRRPTTSAAPCRTSAPASGPSNSLTRRRHRPVATGTTSAAARPASPPPTRPTRTSSTPASTAATSRATTTAPARPRNVSIYPYNPSGHGAEDLRYRFQWTAPILISPHDPKVIYHAANVLFQIGRRRPDLEGRSAPT